MAIPLHALADTFTTTLCTGPRAGIYAKLCEIDAAQAAAAQLHTLATSLAPHVQGPAAVSEESLTQLVDRYALHHKALSDNPRHLSRLFSRYLLDHVQGTFQPEGITRLATAMGEGAPALLKQAEGAGKLLRPTVFASVANVGVGCQHLFAFKPGLQGRNPRASALAYAGAAAVLHGGTRAVIGTDDPDDHTRTHHWTSGGVECLAGAAALAAALTIAGKNMRGLT